MTMRDWTRGAVAMGALLGGLMGVAGAQVIPPEQGGVARPGSPVASAQTGSTAGNSRIPGGMDPANDTRRPGVPAAVQEKMAIARNDERMKKLKADTDQLLALATQLKTDVDKTDKYTLSLDVVKRTAEIEKLAKNIRERMKD